MNPFHSVIQTPTNPIGCFDAGAGESVLYFHGTGVDGSTAASFEMDLPDDGFRLIAMDRPGYGATPLADRISTADCARVANELLDTLGLNTVHIMGSSAGAMFAAAFAVNYPSRAKSLVLMCPQLHQWNDRRWLPASSRWTLPFLRRSWLRTWLLWGYRTKLPRMTPSQFLKMEAGERFDEFQSDETALDLCREILDGMMHCSNSPGFANDFRVFCDENIFDSQRITIPTLVLHDPLDPIANPEHVAWATEYVDRLETAELHTAGHLVWAGPDAPKMRQLRAEFMRRYSE